MTVPKKLSGTGKKKNFTKAQKIKALKRLEVNGFNLMKTEKELGISVPSLKRWRDELGTEVFGKQPRADIAVRAANAETELKIVRIDIQKRKEETAHMAIDILQARLQDPRQAKKISAGILIEIINLPVVNLSAPTGGDAFTNAINKLAQFEMEKEQRKQKYEEAQVLDSEKE